MLESLHDIRNNCDIISIFSVPYTLVIIIHNYNLLSGFLRKYSLTFKRLDNNNDNNKHFSLNIYNWIVVTNFLNKI